MHFRSFYDAVLRNIEDGGGSSAPADQTASQPVDAGPSPDAGVDTSSSDTPKDDPPSIPEQLSKIWDNAHTPRDASGRFQSRNPSPEGDPNSEPGTGPDAATDPGDGKTTSPQDGGEGTGPDAATDAMPQSWSKEDAEVWNAMPPAARARVLEREQQITQALSRAGNAVRAFKETDPVHRGTEAFREYLSGREKATGVPADRFIHDILRVAHGFDSAQTNDQKLGILGEIISSFGVDISPWIGPDAAEALQSKGQSDQRVEELLARIDRLENGQRQERIAELDRSLTHAIDAFSKNTEAYPHFALVRGDMGRYLGTVDPNDNRPVEALLKDAYDFACLSNPTVRQRVLRAEAERIAKERDQQIDSKADAARRASAGNVKSGVPSPSKQSMSDSIRASADKFYR